MLSTLNSLTATLSRLNINQLKQTSVVSVKSLLDQQNESVNTSVPCRGVRYHFQGFRRNWPEFYYYMKENRHHNPDAWKIRKTRSSRFPGHIDVYGKEDGEREPLDAAVLRFKRLDFGAYIHGSIGRSNKAFKKTPLKKCQEENHVFAFHDFHKKLDRMFTGKLKEKRYFPDDPYEKYHKMSFLKHEFALYKNSKLVEEHANKVYKFDRYRMHMDRIGPMNRRPKEYYQPPGFLKTIKDNNGAYLPQGDNIYHEPEWMAPHFQRTPIRMPDFIEAQKNFHKCKFFLDKDMKFLRHSELYSKRLRPWSRVMHRLRY